jgi:cytochrome c biogenesis protein CcdA
MAFEELKENTEGIRENTKAYIETTMAYYKLKGFKKAMKTVAFAVKAFLIVLCLTFVLLFVSIAGAIFLGNYLHSYIYGFLIVAGVYLILAVIIYSIKDKLVEGPILARFSEIFFNE